MPAAVRVRADFSTVALRRLARQSKDANQSRRLLSLAAVADGKSRAEAAAIGAMDRQTRCDWVHPFNVAEPAGLKDDRTSGLPPRLSLEQKAALVDSASPL